jgi:hypothetical protein
VTIFQIDSLIVLYLLKIFFWDLVFLHGAGGPGNLGYGVPGYFFHQQQSLLLLYSAPKME